MLRYVHRTGVGVISWRQGTISVPTTVANRDNHRVVISRGRIIRTAVGFTAPTSGTIHTISVNGNYVLSGSTKFLFTRVFTSDGNLVFNGSSSTGKTKIVLPEGLITFSGIVAYNRVRVQVSTGTILFTGYTPLIDPNKIITVTTWRALTGIGV